MVPMSSTPTWTLLPLLGAMRNLTISALWHRGLWLLPLLGAMRNQRIPIQVRIRLVATPLRGDEERGEFVCEV